MNPQRLSLSLFLLLSLSSFLLSASADDDADDTIPPDPPVVASYAPNSSPTESFTDGPQDRRPLVFICGKADRPDNCEAIVRMSVREVDTTDAETVVGLILQTSIDDALTKQGLIKNYVNDPLTAANVKTSLLNCNKTYEEALAVINEALATLKKESNQPEDVEKIATCIATATFTLQKVNSFVNETGLSLPTFYSFATMRYLDNALSLFKRYWHVEVSATALKESTNLGALVAVCGKTYVTALCQSMLTKAAGSGNVPTDDPNALVELAVKAIAAEVSEAVEFGKKTLNDQGAKMDEKAKRLVEGCIESNAQAVHHIEEFRDECKAGNKDAQAKIDAAGKSFRECQDSFDEAALTKYMWDRQYDLTDQLEIIADLAKIAGHKVK